MAVSGSRADAAVGAILDEDAPVDEALVEGALLEARVDDVASAGGLLEDADLVLALARVVIVDGVGDGAEGGAALGVPGLDCAGGCWLEGVWGLEGRRYLLSKSRVMPKFCQVCESMGVDQRSLLFRSRSFHVLAGRELWSMRVPAWKLNWLAE